MDRVEVLKRTGIRIPKKYSNELIHGAYELYLNGKIDINQCCQVIDLVYPVNLFEYTGIPELYDNFKDWISDSARSILKSIRKSPEKPISS